jgi:hypothetical protein
MPAPGRLIDLTAPFKDFFFPPVMSLSRCDVTDGTMTMLNVIPVNESVYPSLTESGPRPKPATDYRKPPKANIGNGLPKTALGQNR